MKQRPGIVASLVAAALFGAGTPLAKRLLGAVDPWLLAGLLYLGSGVGLFLYRRLTRAAAVKLAEAEVPWLAGAILAGGVVAPVLLMFGLAGLPAANASLLLNAEVVFTALLAWFAFRENFDRRLALGVLAIVAGAVVLSWEPGATLGQIGSSLAVLGACLAWAIDNNLTRKVSLADAAWITCVKGLSAGSVNLALAFALGARLPTLAPVAGGLLIGFVSYGVSLALLVIGLRHLGAARAIAYFSVAPFAGALLALALGDPLTERVLAAGVLMGVGVWLHLSERHEHEHAHEAMEHAHEHVHDEHHQHAHVPGDVEGPGMRHRHRHRHEPMTHSHPHYPDAHHRHEH